MGKLEEEVNILLKSIYRIGSEIVFSIYSVDKDYASKLIESLENFKFGYLLETFQNSADAVSKLVFFFEDYVEGIVKGLEFFSNLVLSLGIKEYSEILSQKNRLEDFIQLDMLDLDFLKFQMRTTEELIYPQFEKILADTIEKSERLREVPALLRSDILYTFIEEVEKQKKDWNKIQKMLNLCFSIVEKETDISTCVNQISEVINEFVMFAANLRNLASHVNQILVGKLELSIDNVRQFSETIKQLSQNLIILVKCRTKVAEYISGSFFQIFTMLWGSKENALEKLKSFIRSETSSEDLIPKSFSLENLEFGLVQARNEILLADRAHKRVEENVKAMREAADYLNSPVLGEYYETFVKEIEIVNKYLPKYSQKVVELQNLLHKKSTMKTII